MMSKELTHLLNSIDRLVNHEAGYSWEAKRRMILQAFREAKRIEALEEFLSWFEEERESK